MKAAAIITLDQQRYYIQRTKVSLSPRLTNQLRNLHGELIPVTAVLWHKSLFEEGDLARVCREYEVVDDVWNINFLPGRLECAVHIIYEKLTQDSGGTASASRGED